MNNQDRYQILPPFAMPIFCVDVARPSSLPHHSFPPWFVMRSASSPPSICDSHHEHSALSSLCFPPQTHSPPGFHHNRSSVLIVLLPVNPHISPKTCNTPPKLLSTNPQNPLCGGGGGIIFLPSFVLSIFGLRLVSSGDFSDGMIEVCDEVVDIFDEVEGNLKVVRAS